MLNTKVKIIFLISAILLCLPNTSSAVMTEVQKQEVALELAKLFEAAKQVIEDKQDLINDPTKKDKKLTGTEVIRLTQSYYDKTKSETFDPVRSALFERSQRALYSSIFDVMRRAQFLINEEGGGFKGFISAVFIRQVMDGFNQKLNGRVIAKITAERNIVRNQNNWPDNWENKMIKNKLGAEDWPKGQIVFASTKKKDKNVFRLLLPIYHQQSCLTCHGEPKGEKDSTGGTKEGAKLDDLAGAISVSIYVE